MMKVNKILKIRNIFLLAIVLAVGSYMILFVYNSFFKTTDIPFKYKIESIEMERVTFGQDSMTLKKYLMKIRLSDEDVQSKHYPLLHYMNGIKDSVVSVAVKDINGKDIQEVLNIKGKEIGNILHDIEVLVLKKELENDKEVIKKYMVEKYSNIQNNKNDI